MIEALTWIQANYHLLLEGAAALYVLASIYVRLTPSAADDAWLRRFTERASFLQPKNAEGVLSLPGAPPKHFGPLESRK